MHAIITDTCKARERESRKIQSADRVDLQTRWQSAESVAVEKQNN